MNGEAKTTEQQSKPSGPDAILAYAGPPLTRYGRIVRLEDEPSAVPAPEPADGLAVRIGTKLAEIEASGHCVWGYRDTVPFGIYVASRASVPERAALWRTFRADGWPIVSTWIDEDGEGATEDFGELWERITREVTGAAGLVFYAEPGDLPLKGALVEVGMALAAGVPVYAHLPGIALEPRSMRPVGSWLRHPLVTVVDRIETALTDIVRKGNADAE